MRLLSLISFSLLLLVAETTAATIRRQRDVVEPRSGGPVHIDDDERQVGIERRATSW